MIGTIVQFMKQDGNSQQTVSIDQPPRIVIDAISCPTICAIY